MLSEYNPDDICFKHPDHRKPFKLKRYGIVPKDERRDRRELEWPSVEGEAPCNAFGYNRG
uniref:Uncharacterized protein n=1 Tax=viral metagenome TaxID=1070528 RepID=A0A6M3JFZ4_9ZZZZ